MINNKLQSLSCAPVSWASPKVLTVIIVRSCQTVEMGLFEFQLRGGDGEEAQPSSCVGDEGCGGHGIHTLRTAIRPLRVIPLNPLA